MLIKNPHNIYSNELEGYKFLANYKFYPLIILIFSLIFLFVQNLIDIGLLVNNNSNILIKPVPIIATLISYIANECILINKSKESRRNLKCAFMSVSIIVISSIGILGNIIHLIFVSNELNFVNIFYYKLSYFIINVLLLFALIICYTVRITTFYKKRKEEIKGIK